MYTHRIGDISISSILDKRRPYVNGEFPVRIRVHYHKQKKYYSTGKTCNPEIWDKLPSAKGKSLVDMRTEIQDSFSVIKSHVLDLFANDEFSLDNLDKRLQRISGETLNYLLAQKIAELKKAEQIGTMECYANTLSNITKFRGENIPIENVDVEWLNDFEAYMLPSKSVATLGINMRNIRAMMNIAKRNELIKEKAYPFGKGKYEIRTSEGIKKALTSIQLKAIMNVNLENKTLARYRDLFLFIYYCNGINIADLINLKFKNIIDGEIYFIREKTKRTSQKVAYIKAPLTKEIKEIIDRWGNKNEPENFIFETVVHTKDSMLNHKRKKTFTKQFNEKIHLVGAAVGIFEVNSYTARHTYATVLKRKGVSISYISESLGHTSLNTTKAYLDSFEKDERVKNSKFLSDL